MDIHSFGLADLLRELGTNAGLISFLVFGYSIFGPGRPGAGQRSPQVERLWMPLAMGVMFGVGTCLAMMVPLTLGQGIIFDTRPVILALCGCYVPFPGPLVAMFIAAVFRFQMGGAGMVPGVMIIVTVPLLAMLWRHWRPRLVTEGTGFLHSGMWLYGIGLIVSVVGPAYSFALPTEVRDAFLRHVAPLTVTIFPVAMVIFGLLIEGFLRLSAREASLRELALKNEQAASVFHNCKEAILILDGSRHIADVNPGFCQMTGYDRHELIGQHIDLLKSGRHDEAYISSLMHRLQTKGHWEGEMWRRRKNGEVFPSQVSIAVVRDAEGLIKQQIIIGEDLTEKRRHEEELARATSYDPLTGLPNRRLFTQRLQAAMAESHQSGKLVAVCYFDLDGFKLINERHGHKEGDALLVQLADRLKSEMRETDLLGRLGGDEFVVLLAGLADKHEAMARLEHMRWRIKEPIDIDGAQESVSASIGLTFYPEDRADADALLRHADQAMYAAKDLGKDQAHVFDAERDVRIQARRDTLVRIEQAIDAEEMVLFYQPKVRLSNGKLFGVEALIRWRHPERGVLAPAVFLDQIMGTPVAQRLDYWVLGTAFKQAHAWHGVGLHVPISVNMTVSTLVEPRFLSEMRQLLSQYAHLPRYAMEVELLETETMNDLSLVAYIIEELDRMGVHVSIDDFGTGYSSLSYLQRLPAHIIKIDRSFVRDMLDNPSDLALVQGIVGLAHAFGREPVAEGVETHAHAQRLGAMGCDIVQGYGIARPMPADALAHWARTWRLPAEFGSQGAAQVELMPA